MKIKNTKYLYLSLSVFFIVIFITLNIYGWFNHKTTTDYWNTLWTGISALSVPISIFAAIHNDRNARAKIKKDKKKEKYNKLNDSYNRFIYNMNINMANIINSYNNKMRNLNTQEKDLTYQKKVENDDNKLIKSIVLILSEFNEFWYQYESNKFSISDNENFGDPMDILRKTKLPKLLATGSLNLEEYKDEDHFFSSNIQESFPNLRDAFDRVAQLYESTDDKISEKKQDREKQLDNSYIDTVKKFENELKNLKTESDLPENLLTEKFKGVLGDWIVSLNRAKNVKYVVAVSSIDSRVKVILKVKDPETNINENDRIRFDVDSADYILPFNSDENEAVESFEEWNSRNPVIYLNTWLKLKNVNKNNLKKLISKKFEDNEISDDDSILVVKTRNYWAVTAADVREEIKKIFTSNLKSTNTNDNKEISRANLVYALTEKFPYLIDHPGVYQGVLNKLDTNKIFVDDKHKHVFKVKNKPAYELVDETKL